MKKTFCFFIVLYFTATVNAQLNIYAAFTIPDSLKKDADVVIREDYLKFTIKDINTAKQETHEIVTILNEEGSRYLNFAVHSDKFHVLDEAEIKVYDAFGKKINTYSKKEMTAFNYGEGLVPEGKYTSFKVSAPSYPITIETNYTIKYRGILGYPSNTFQSPYNSVQHGLFIVEAPADLSFRYKLVNCNYQPKIVKDGDKETYQWEVSGLKAYKLEKHCGAYENFLPQIFLAPNKFQLDDFDGDMTSWKNYGDWINKLYAATTKLTDEQKLLCINLVKDAKSDKEKAVILYKYLQDNMRYVSIQLGIGGWRPFPASFVLDKKYGDCKALSNCLKSALDAVGVKSNIIIIYRDYDVKYVDEKFPMNAFNHVILNIPQPNDTIWLECTSTTLPFATLDETTLNRKAVMITDNGGIIVNTPPSNYKNNSTSALTNIITDENGGAKVVTTYKTIGEDRSQLTEYFHDLNDDEKRKYFIRGFEWKQPDVIEVSSLAKTDNPYVVTAKMQYEKIYPFKAGSKYFLEPRLYPIFDEDIPETEKRVRDYYFTFPYQNIDTTVYHFVDGFSVESMPKDKIVNLPFATYTCTYTWNAAAHSVTIIALLQIKERVVKAADYAKLIDFKKQVVADNNEKIVMKKE